MSKQDDQFDTVWYMLLSGIVAYIELTSICREKDILV